MGKKKMYKKNANGCSGDGTTLDEALEIHKNLFKFSSRGFHWEPLFEQEHSQEELQEMLDTKPHEYVRCKLKMERHDLAYAKPLKDLTSTICISGKDAVGRSFPGDEVCVQILSRTCQLNRGESVKGKVVGLLDRSEKSCTIICRMEGHKQLATPVKKNMTRIRILKKQQDKIEIRKINPKDGHYVPKRSIDMAEDQLLVVKVLKWEKTHQYPLGAVTKVISHEEYYKVLLELEYGIKDSPPPFQPKCDQKENEERNLTFTIDPSDAYALDDAFSLSDHGEQYMIAIHITDVASVIRKGSKEDTFAKKQGRTFYNVHLKANKAFMLSEESSNEFLSLLPGQKRKTISLKIMINKATNIIESSNFTRSVIKSDRRLSYEEADKIIQEFCPDDSQAPLRFSSVEDCIAVAYCFTKELRNFRLEGTWSSGQRNGDSRAHCMVEELMIFYNNAVAEKLISKDLTRDLTPLRCHFKPDPDQFELFKRKYSPLLPLSPHLSQICEVPEAKFEEAKEFFIHVFRPVFEHMESLAQKRDYHKLVHLIINDEIHPTLRHMAKEFKEIQNKAVILRSCSNLSSRLGHYDLQLNTYTCASSPLRRYLDLVLQRLLHSVLSDRHQLGPNYTKEEIDHFCDKCDSTEDFDLESLRLINATKSSSRDVTKLAVVDQISPNEHQFIISVPLDRLSGLKIEYRNLKVVEQPAFKAQSCTLTWKRRVYSFIDSIKPELQHKVSENKNIILISGKNWIRMISAAKAEDWGKVSECLRDVKEEKNNIKYNVIMSKAYPTEQNHFKVWEMELKSEDVLQVQLGTEVVNGATLPAVNLLTLSPSFEVCLEHARNPIKCFTPTDGTVCYPSKTKYKDYKEYQKIWGKLCQMDTAYNAVEENNSVILEDVSIKWTGTTETSLEGYFKMTQQQTKDWSLEFDLTNCYLCVRLRDQYAKKEEKTETTQCNDSNLSDLQNTLPSTWVAHGITIKSQAQKQGNKNTENKSNIKIHFQINSRKMLNIPCTLQEKDTKFTVEVIPKKIPYVQYEHAIKNIKIANELVKSIATGTVFKVYNTTEELEPADDDMDHNLDLPPLNESQKIAVQEALNNPFTVIQGPPGTGKTVVGVYITYQFYMMNKRHEAQAPKNSTKPGQDEKKPKKRGILYCGSSNKSVDIVAEQLLKLKEILRPLRIYCDQMEMREYPYPGSNLNLCRRALRDEKPKEALRKILLEESFDQSHVWNKEHSEIVIKLHFLLFYRGISLMQLVRDPGNPHSAEIQRLENCESDFNIESYKKELKEAQKYELLRHDVILCTCSTALKPILMETMDFRQILIDECAMATEPEAFIPLVSHKPEQIVLLGDHKQIRPIVTCARVKELGMEKSLFERYMDRALMLNTQYRMHKHICEFPSNEFYGGKLRTGTKQRTPLLLDRNNTPTAILFGHVEGQEISLVVSTAAGNERSAANEQEAEQAVRVANLLVRLSRVQPEDIAILTPYNAQMCKIKEMLGQKENQALQGVNICTIMKSQGSEWRYVILSTVRSCPLSEIVKESYISKGWLGKKLGFITDPNQVNVAITRAQDGLCILGNRDLLNCSELWHKLLSHYQRRDCVLDSAEDIKVRRHFM
ncbi:helicase with zinc finger domain 2-like [Clarias gariepinus]|uniref:helicase with zinc finger domain 2-like n=1 Tax=Clarias gariepinus TaxID=13013 RepID=UPI00234CED33|nr:helicase with zinc finger domain 2-like [Clarias gariepinus]